MVAPQDIAAAQFGFVAQSTTAEQLLVPWGFGGAGYLHSMVDAGQRLDGRARATLVDNEDELLALGSERGAKAWSWQEGCRCVAPLGAQYDARVAQLQQALGGAAGMPLTVRLSMHGQGLYRRFSWAVEGVAGQISLHVQAFDRYALPGRGALVFGLDNTSRLSDPARLRVIVQTPAGARVQTPWLDLPISGSADVQWPLQAPGPR
ncbi:MAG: hypothetical protein H7Z19_03985 [Chitinophagaceae bacterium]|nr:hypothetical protein [Rubrivivax sp.]